MDKILNHRSPLFFALVMGLSLSVVGCNEQAGKTKEKGEVLATVNGETITEGELSDYRKARPDLARVQNQEALLDELVTQTIVYQEALRQKLDKDPEVLNELEMLRTSVLASAAVRKAMNDDPVTDEELRAEYDNLKERMVTTEFKASHILVKEEELANKLIKQLDKGADFAKLAKEHSTDTSAQNGGDLGWFNPQQMVPPFSQALVQLEKGTYTKQPVKTQFGWHIIKLEDSRRSEPPAFEEIKGRLEQMLKQRKIREYIQALKDKADISIKGKDEAPAAKKPAESTDKESGAPAEEKSAGPAEDEGEASKEKKSDTANTQ